MNLIHSFPKACVTYSLSNHRYVNSSNKKLYLYIWANLLSKFLSKNLSQILQKHEAQKDNEYLSIYERTQIYTKYFMKYVMQSVFNLKFALDLWKMKRVIYIYHK